MFAEQAFPNSAPPEPGMLRDLRATATKVRDADGRRGLSVLAHAVSRRALGSPTTPDLLRTCAIVPLSVAFPFQAHGRHPDCVFRSSIPGPSMPLSTLHPAPRGTRRKTRGQDVRYCFLVGLFHPRLHAGLSRRLRLLTRAVLRCVAKALLFSTVFIIARMVRKLRRKFSPGVLCTARPLVARCLCDRVASDGFAVERAA
jgi:hypothetical protein